MAKKSGRAKGRKAARRPAPTSSGFSVGQRVRVVNEQRAHVGEAGKVVRRSAHADDIVVVVLDCKPHAELPYVVADLAAE